MRLAHFNRVEIADSFLWDNKMNRFFWLVLALCVTVMGCSDGPERASVDFTKRVSVEKPTQIDSSNDVVHMAIGAMVSPKETLSSYQELVNYQIGRAHV